MCTIEENLPTLHTGMVIIADPYHRYCEKDAVVSIIYLEKYLITSRLQIML